MSVPVEPNAGRPATASRVSPEAFDSAKENVLGKRHSALIKQAAAGDTEALTLLLRAARPVVYDWAYQMTGDPDGAEDITQTVMVRVWIRLPDFRGDSRLSSWLFRITSNQVSEARRRKKARLGKSKAWAALCTEEREPSRISALDLWVFEERVRALARALPPLQQAIFRLVDLDGWKPHEVARELGKTQTTIRSSLCKARKKVRHSFEKGAVSTPPEWADLAS